MRILFNILNAIFLSLNVYMGLTYGKPISWAVAAFIFSLTLFGKLDDLRQ